MKLLGRLLGIITRRRAKRATETYPRSLRNEQGIYFGCVCDVCGEIVPGGKKGHHMNFEHPAYRFIALRRWEAGGRLHYICVRCGATVPSLRGLVKHYRERHVLYLAGVAIGGVTEAMNELGESFKAASDAMGQVAPPPAPPEDTDTAGEGD